MLLSKDYECDYKPSYTIGKVSDEQKKALNIIVNKLENGTYKFESTNCCLCGGNTFYVLAKKDRYGLPCCTCMCSSCGLIQINPRMTEESYKEFYCNDYRTLEGIPDDKVCFDRQYEKSKQIISKLEKIANSKYLSKPCNVLEVGCYNGGTLKAFTDRGYKCTGIDLDGNVLGTIDFAETYNCTISELGEEFNKKFDVVVYIHVFEHIIDLINELDNIKRVLSDTGFVFVSVPSIKSLQNNSVNGVYFPFTAFCQLAHTYGFSTHTLKNLFERNGFSTLYMEDNIGIYAIFNKLSFVAISTLGFLVNNEKQRIIYEKRSRENV